MGIDKHKIKVSRESIDKLFLKLNEIVLDAYRLDDNESICNPVFNVSCESGKEYVLKIINPLKKWEKIKTINEVYSMKLIRDKTKIPIPEIYDFSFSKNALGHEYILMEKIKGEILKKNFEKNKLKYLSQIADFIKEFQKFSYNRIGSFGIDNSIEIDLDAGDGPFISFKEWVTATIKSRFKYMKNTKYKKYIPRFEAFCKTIEDTDLPVFFCHGDLSQKNMIEKDGKIVGVFDFEWAGAFPYVYDAANYIDDYNLNDSEKKEFYKMLNERNVLYKMNERVKDIKLIESLAMTLVHYKDWYVGREEEGEENIINDEKKLISLFKKYNI